MLSVDNLNSIESEAGIIASLIHNPEFSFYSESLLPEHFTNKENRLVYIAICELARKSIKTVDPYNILEALNSDENTRQYIGGITVEALQDLVDMSIVLARASIDEYKMLVSNVMDAALRRKTFEALKECQALCLNMTEPDIEKKIYEKIDDVMLDFTTTADVPLYKDVVDDMWREIEERQQGVTEAIEFPFSKLNDYVVMEPGEAVCFAAPQKAGKSAMLLTCTIDMLKRGKSVLYVDSEISTKLFTIRMLSHLTGVKFNKLRSGLYTAEEAELIKKAVSWIKTRNFIHIYVPVLNADSLYLTAKKAKHLIDIDCIVVDYLKADSAQSQAFEVYAGLGNLSDCLKNKIAGELNICALTAAQATSTGKIADSSRIARSMSTIINITDKTIEEIEADGSEMGTKKMRVLYNRNGAQMDETEYIDMDFDGSTCKYKQARKQHDPEASKPY